jgi:hypothetical protein
VKWVLKKRYPTTPEISRNGQAVTITFTDFKVDVVPAFNRNGGGYLIPNSINQRWIATDPKRHVEIWSGANAAHHGDLVPLIKMIKGWNKKHGAPLRSFHLETMVLTILNNVNISNYPSGVRYVFDKARQVVRFPIPDPAGYNGNIGDYLNTLKLVEVINKLDKAYCCAVDAESAEQQGRTRLAFEKWRQIFNDSFPAYG